MYKIFSTILSIFYFKYCKIK